MRVNGSTRRGEDKEREIKKKKKKKKYKKEKRNHKQRKLAVTRVLLAVPCPKVNFEFE